MYANLEKPIWTYEQFLVWVEDLEQKAFHKYNNYRLAELLLETKTHLFSRVDMYYYLSEKQTEQGAI